MQDDEDDDDDDDFHPGFEDEDDDFSDDEGDECEEEIDEIPPFLQGYLMAESTDTQTILFREHGTFCLKSEGKIPVGWSLYKPLLAIPVSFKGWIRDPTKNMNFKVQIVEQEIDDSLDEKLLQAQREKLTSTATPRSEKEGQKKSASCLSLVDKDRKAPPDVSTKCPPLKPAKLPFRASVLEGKVKSKTYSIVGSAFDEQRYVSFRGVFCPATTAEDKVFIICPTKLENGAKQDGTRANPTHDPAAAAKRKREDDDEDPGRFKIDYQELIDLHEDARLSGLELRKRHWYQNR